MSILTIVSYSVHPERAAIFEEALAQVAERAREVSGALRWSTGQVICGDLGHYEISMRSESVAEAAQRATASAMLGRLFDAREAQRLLGDLSQSIREGRTSMLRDRTDLSYAPELTSQLPVAWVILRALIRRGSHEACEALFTHTAEAIPKVGDPRRFDVWQPVIGNLLEIIAVRPIFELEQLDTIESLSVLLQKSLGKSYGSKIHRNGLAAFDETESTLLAYREDLSNRGSGEPVGGI